MKISAVQAAVLPVVRDKIGVPESNVVPINEASDAETVTPDAKVTHDWAAATRAFPPLEAASYIPPAHNTDAPPERCLAKMSITL